MESIKYVEKLFIVSLKVEGILKHPPPPSKPAPGSHAHDLPLCTCHRVAQIKYGSHGSIFYGLS